MVEHLANPPNLEEAVLVLESRWCKLKAVMVALGVDHVLIVVEDQCWLPFFTSTIHAVCPILKTARKSALNCSSSCFGSHALEINGCDLGQGQ